MSAPQEIGPYRIVRELGQGGMGSVYEVEGPGGRRLALKVLHHRAARGEAAKRFLREYEALARVAHPNVVGVWDAGETPRGPYLVMDLLDGRSLDQVLKERGPLPPARAARLVRDLADACAAVHDTQVLHRDIKPENVVLVDSGQTPVLVDFGLSTMEEAEHLTRTGQLLGTPYAMSPEQASGRTSELGPSTDVYGLGIVLYVALTGGPPFVAAGLVELLAMVCGSTPAWPDAPPALLRVLRRCLAKRPEERYQTAAELRAALDEHLAPAQRSPLPRAAAVGLAAAGLALGIGWGVSSPQTTAAAPPRLPAPPTTEAPEEAPTPGWSPARAEALLEERRWDDALTALEGADRQDVAAWILRARIFQSREHYRSRFEDKVRAGEAMARARELAPEQHDVVVWSALVDASPEVTETARRAFEAGATRHLPLAWVAEARRRWLEALSLQGEAQAASMRSALEHIAQALVLDPRCRMAQLYKTSNDYAYLRRHAPDRLDLAVAGAQEAIASYPTDPLFRVRLGLILKGMAEAALPSDPAAARELLDQALAEYQRAVDLDPTYASAWVERGYALSLAYSAGGRVDRALADEGVACLQEAVRITPRNAVTRHVLACVYEISGRDDDAIRAWEDAIALGPTRREHLDYLRRLAGTHLRRGHLGAGRDALLRCLPLLQGEADTMLRRATKGQIAEIERRLGAPR